MGQICGAENYPESKKIFYSLKSINQENHFEFTINNYDSISKKIQSLSKNTFEKLGQMQQLRVDFIQEIREELNIANEIKDNNNNLYYPDYENPYNNYKYHQRINTFNYYNFNEIEKILYYIIIMTLTLKSYLKRNYISNELEKSLLELSIVILKKKYSKKDLKVILYYLSRMLEILFTNFHYSQNYININEYLKKISTITNDYYVLKEDEKYPFIMTHIITLGEFFCNDYNDILINSENQSFLMKYYVYLIIYNYDFITKNHSTYTNMIMKKAKINNSQILTNSTYNKNDLMEADLLSENIMKKSKEYDDMIKISKSIEYFLMICSQDTFTGKNIFNEFDNQLELGLRESKIEKKNEIDLIKFKEAVFMILFSNLNPSENNSTMFLSFFEYFYDNKKIGIQNYDIYNEMIINLYGKFNNNKIFIDKYSFLISRIFIREKENYKNENLIIDKLYDHIYKLNKKYNDFKNPNEDQINSDNLYFFINLIKHISSYYNKLRNIKIAYDILIYLTKFLHNMRVVFKKSSNYNNIHLQIHENFNITLNNFDYNKDDYYTSLNENILIPLSNFISNYIILVNDFFEIKENLIFDNSIITTISYLEVSLIQNNIKKNIQIIIKLVNIYINILKSSDLIDYENINNNLNNNLRIIINEIKVPNINYGRFNYNLQFNIVQLKLIYFVILIILIEINKNSDLSDLISKHNKIIISLNQFNNYLGSHFFPNSENIQSFNIKKLIFYLSQGEVFNIEKKMFEQIIYIIKKIIFNEKDEFSENSLIIYRTRTHYQKDNKSENNISFNNINNIENYSKNLPIFLGNYHLLNDSFSYISNNSLAYNKSNLNIPQNMQYYNLNKSDNFSENVNLPYKDNNNIINFSEQNKTFDIISDKNSSNYNFKI